MTDQQWMEDIKQLKETLPKVHVDFFRNHKAPLFFEKIKALEDNLENLETREVVVWLAEAVATIGDAHTVVQIPQSYRFPFEVYPFEEGVFITKTTKALEGICYGEILKIEGLEILEVIQGLKEVISHENDVFVWSVLPNFLTCGDFLYGAGLIDGLDNIRFTIKNIRGEMEEVVVDTLRYQEYHPIKPKIPQPLFMENPNAYYWSYGEDDWLYVSYRHCKDMEHYKVSDFCGDLIETLTTQKGHKKLILDFRNNIGGNSQLFLPFLKWVSEDYSGKLYVIVGRDTFSSGLLNVYYLKLKNKGVFVGEPTGGKPNCFGEVKVFSLTHSGLSIRYSTQYYQVIEDDHLKSFYPEIIFKRTFKDYLKGRDCCLEWIKKQK
ncbi:MAG: hypothetical protein ACRCU3_02150 [Eubacteriaceae bacterium]